jgi:hypothetical protein
MISMQMHRRCALLVIASLAALGACTGTATRGSAPTARVAPPTQPLITRLLIDYTPTAARQTEGDGRFSAVALSRAVGAGLALEGLADLSNSAVLGVAAIEVDEFDVSATANVVLMGRVASRGVLGATVRLRDGSGVEHRMFHVRADMPLKVTRNGTDRNTLQKLYQEFTALIADELVDPALRPAQAR